MVFAAERNFEGLQVTIVTTCTGATQGDTPNSCIDVAVDVDVSVFSVQDMLFIDYTLRQADTLEPFKYCNSYSWKACYIL